MNFNDVEDLVDALADELDDSLTWKRDNKNIDIRYPLRVPWLDSSRHYIYIYLFQQLHEMIPLGVASIGYHDEELNFTRQIHRMDLFAEPYICAHRISNYVRNILSDPHIYVYEIKTPDVEYAIQKLRSLDKSSRQEATKQALVNIVLSMSLTEKNLSSERNVLVRAMEQVSQIAKEDGKTQEEIDAFLRSMKAAQQLLK